MNKKIPILFASVLAVLMLMMSLGITQATVNDYSNQPAITSPFTADVPTLDGNITAGEYANAKVVSWAFIPDAGHSHSLDVIDMYIMNTNSTIYIAFDLTWDTTQEIGGMSADYITVAFDQNADGDFVFQSSAHDAELYIDSMRGWGDDTSAPDVRYSFAWGFASTPADLKYDHTIAEIAIPLSSFNYGDETLAVGDTFGFHAEGADGTSDTWLYPIDSTSLWSRDYVTGDAVDWAQVTLGAYVAPSPVTNPATTAPVDHSMDIGMVIAIIGVVVILACTAFKDDLGNKYWWLVLLGAILALAGGANYFGGYVKTIPVIAP